MLQELYVENFALIDKVSLHLAEGFNVITGETGAGKSLLLDAVSLLMGGRAQEHLIRDGYEKCLVQGIFPLPCPNEVTQLLLDDGLDIEDDALILSREYFRNSRNCCRLNGRTIPLSLLRQLGRLLVNIHGQMEHMVLLQEDKQLQLLDSFGGDRLLSKKNQVGDAYLRMHSWKSKAQAYEGEKKERAQRVDWLEFQIEEIGSFQISPEEFEELETEKNRLVHGEKLLSGAQGATESLDKAGNNLAKANSALEKIASLDEELAKLEAEIKDIYYSLEDVSLRLADYRDEINIDPRRLEDVDNRLADLKGLCRKYGPELQDVLEYAANAQLELEQLKEIELSGAHYEEEYQKERQIYIELCEELRSLREKAGQALSGAVTQELKQLYMENACMSVEFQACEPAKEGLETVAFMIQSNAGEKAQPLSKIASGGELARLVLALKVILARLDQVPTLIFDEIDSGLGGRALNAVARKIVFISEECQVLCVTHGPIMAAAADHHIHIYKESFEGRTVIRVQSLEGIEREKEISRMIAGEKITETALAQARDMINIRK